MATAEDLLDSIVTGTFELKQFAPELQASPELRKTLIHIDNEIQTMVDNLKEDLGLV